MVGEQNFLDYIREHPRDTFAPLVFADWLEERGDPRAEFIRLQVERQTLERHPDSANPEITERLQLLSEAEEAWRAAPAHQEYLSALQGMPRASTEILFMYMPATPVFTSGLCQGVECSMDTYRAHGQQMADALPLFRELHLTGHMNNSDVQDIGALARVQKLDLRQFTLTEDNAFMLGRPSLSGLQELVLDGQTMTGHTSLTVFLAGMRNLGNLESLSVRDGNNNFDNLLTSHLLSAGRGGMYDSVRELDLTGNNFNTDVLNAFTGAFFYLEQFSIARNEHMNDESAATLARSGLPFLRELDISGTNIGDAGARQIVERLPSLKQVHLFDTPQISAEVREELQDVLAARQNNAMLDISHGRVPDNDTLRLILEQYPNLKGLDVGRNPNIDNGSAAVIAECCPQLERLNIDASYIDEHGAGRMVKALPKLQELSIRESSIGANTAKQIERTLESRRSASDNLPPL